MEFDIDLKTTKECWKCYGSGTIGYPEVRCETCGGAGSQLTDFGDEIVKAVRVAIESGKLKIKIESGSVSVE